MRRACLLLALVACQPSAEELERRATTEEAAFHERARLAVEARKAKEAEDARHAEALAKADADKAQRDKEAAAKLYRERLETYWAMDPAGRERALREECRGGCSATATVIAEAGASEAERRKLSTLARQTDAREQARMKASATADERRAREDFASNLDALLLDRHLSPDRVVAAGTVLRIEIFLCSRQLIHDLTSPGKNDISGLARAKGFTRIECSSSLQGAWQDL